ncbi:hypothetical protein KLP28_15220 [Nocardioidaceae bacterium]|nr:hypothetical protein KLP28_15220 [Nocardioidaceae bacterium]
MTHPDTTALRVALEREAAPAPAPGAGLEVDDLWRRGTRRRRLRQTVAGGAVAAMAVGMAGIGFLVVDGAPSTGVADGFDRAPGIPASVEQPAPRTPVLDGEGLAGLADASADGVRVAMLGEATITTDSESGPAPLPWQVGTEYDASWVYALTTDGTYRFLDLRSSALDVSSTALATDGTAVARLSLFSDSGSTAPDGCRSSNAPLLTYETVDRDLRGAQVGRGGRQWTICDSSLAWSGDGRAVSLLLTELDDQPALYVDRHQVSDSMAIRKIDQASDIVVGRSPAGVLWTRDDVVHQWEFREGVRDVGPAEGARQVVVAPFAPQAVGVTDDGSLRTTAWPPTDGSWSTVPGPAVAQVVGWVGGDAVVVQERDADSLTVRSLDGSSRPYGADLPPEVVDHASTALAVELLDRPLGPAAQAPSYWYRAPAVRTTAVLGLVGAVIASLVWLGVSTQRQRASRGTTSDDWWDGDAR